MGKENIPDWAKNLKAWGERMEAKYGSKKICHPYESEDILGQAKDDKEWGHRWKRQNPVGDIFGQFICYLIITYVPVNFPGFFLGGWPAVYTVIVLSILIHVAVDLLRIILRGKAFYYLGQVIANIASILSMIVMVSIFPFNFPGNVGGIVQFALWIAIVIVSIVTFFQFMKIFTPDWESK